MTRLLGLLVLFFAILFVQAVALTEAFGSSQGGAQIQLAASRTGPPMIRGSYLNLQGPQPLFGAPL